MTYSFVDIHCHLLPGVDDGAKHLDDALAMARLAVEDGATTIIATPHQLGSFGHNRGDDLRERVARLQRELDAADVAIQVLPGAEVRIEPGMVEAIARGEVLSLGDHRRHVLLELPHELYLPLEPVLGELSRRKMVGVLAHPERNHGILRQPSVLHTLVDAGCLMQITAGSVCGTFGPECQQFCDWMLAERLVHFVATDAHGVRSRRPLMLRAYERVAELTDEATALDLCSVNPGNVALGNPCDPDGVRSRAAGEAGYFRPGKGPQLNEGIEARSASKDLPTILACAAGSNPRIFLVRLRKSIIVAAAGLLSGVATLAPGEGVRWSETRQVGPFIFHSTFPLAPYERLFAELPELQRELTRTLGVPPAKNPIYVYLFSDETQYRAYKDLHFPRVPFRPALFIMEGGAPGVYTYRKADLEIDLRHECTHALLHSSLPVVPLWLDEGLAKYFEVPACERSFDHPYFDDPKWKWSLRLGMVRSIESLEERNDLTEMDAADYRFSWAWVHFMLHGPEEAHRALVKYLASYQQYEPPGKLSARLAAAVPNPTDEMILHFKHWHE